MDTFLQHPVLWWNGLDLSARVALLAVLVGACTVGVALWLGVRRWWRSWKQDPAEDDE